MSENQDLLSVTAFFSALVHVLVILGISFKLPDIKVVDNTDNTLDVVLINTPNNEVPDEAQTVSTSSNSGGGRDDQEASTPIPFKAVAEAPVQSIKKTAQQQATNQVTDQLLSSATNKLSIERKPSQNDQLKAHDSADGKDKVSTKSQRQLERERLIAKLNQRYIDYQKRPKKEFLSPTTTQHAAAQYLDNWRKKIEHVGNANYPQQAKVQALSGSLILTVELNKNGTINAIHINHPSPHKLLNDAAVRFVRDASPYDVFPDDINKDTDILVITRSFHFMKNNRLSSSDAASQRPG